jgi:pimeloyl-ACP methyl ester carboxylesterase
MLRRSADRRPGYFTSVDGVLVHWHEMGEGNANVNEQPPLVLLHGIGDSHRTWLSVAPMLARSRRVLMPDLVGHGLSGRPDASYSLDWHARIIGLWLFERLRLDRVDVVGHSYGGGVAQWMLLHEQAARIRSLGLVAAGGLGREVTSALRLAAIPHLVEQLGQPFMAPGTWLAVAAAGGTYSLPEIVRLSLMNGRRGTARAFGRSVRDVIDVRGQRRGYFQHVHEISRVPPIGLFWGEADPVIPISHAVKAAPHLGEGGARLTRFARLGHYPHREDPKRFASALDAFLTTTSTSTSTTTTTTESAGELRQAV